MAEPTPAQAPPRRAVTWEEYLRDEEGPLREWVSGEAVVHMPATARHQAVIAFLTQLLGTFTAFFGLGRVFSAGYAMRLGRDGPAREPDVMFVAAERRARVQNTHLEGPADLAVEVISDDSVGRDRAEKFYEYQDAGVLEYWVIDPRLGHERADFWLLGGDGRYAPVAPGPDGVYRSTVLRGFWLRTGWFVGDTFPDPQLTLAEIAEFPSDVLASLQRLKAEGQASS